MAYKGIVLRAYPTDTQREMIERTFGCCRFVYNKRLEGRNNNDYYKVRSTDFLDIKKEFFRANPFLNDVDARALKCSLQDQEKAVKGCVEDPNAVKPKYKSRKNHWQFYRTWGVSIIKERSKGFVDLPVVGRVKVRGLCGGYKRIISATVERAPSGKYFITLVVEFAPAVLAKRNNQIGIDVGLDHYYLDDSDKERALNPEHYEKALKRLKRIDRSLKRKREGSKNYEKQRIRHAKLHEKIANQRKDYLQNLTTQLIRDNQTVSVEALDIVNMRKNHDYAMRIASASWRMFRDMLTYKAEWYGRELRTATPEQIGRTSCPHCGYTATDVSDDLTTLRICPKCGKFYDATPGIALKILQVAT